MTAKAPKPPLAVEVADVPAIDTWPRRPSLVSVVCPVYNEAAGIEVFVEELLRVLHSVAADFEVLLVDDGSFDRTLDILHRLHGRYGAQVKVLSLSRNFGHQSALAAGFHHAVGEVVLCMDSDLQHPPALIPTLLYHWARGYQLVYTRRRRQSGGGWLKETTSRWFYRLMNRISDVTFEEGTADFRLMDRSVVAALNRFGERTLFFRGLVNWIGFERIAVEYDAPQRFAGESSYSPGQMLRFAIDGLFAFSLLPLRFSLVIGSVMMLFCWGYGLYSVIGQLLGRFDTPGYTSTVLLITFVGSLNLIFLGIVGEYVGRIHEQVKDRPLFLIKESVGFDESERHESDAATPATRGRGTA